MLDEALATPDVIAALLAEDEAQYARLGQALRAAPPRGIVTIARGSSDHAANYLAYLMTASSGRLVTSLPMSLVTLYHAPVDAQGLLAISISQSGRSPDLVEPITRFRRTGATTVALVNDAGSPLAQAAEWLLPLHAGPEKSVAATKSFLASLVAAARLTAAWCELRDLRAALGELPAALAAASRQDWSRGVELLAGAERLMVLSRGLGLPVAQEAALKFKETSGMQAEAFSGAEVRHGPMALVGEDYPVLVLAVRGPAQAQLLEQARQLRDSGARVVLAAPADVADRDLTLSPAPLPDLDPLTAIQSFYVMVESISRARGRDPDRPPNLNKVTVTR